eukprot:Nk52_evm17s2462 gene=Nk52_evmTU17s2462
MVSLLSSDHPDLKSALLDFSRSFYISPCYQQIQQHLYPPASPQLPHHTTSWPGHPLEHSRGAAASSSSPNLSFSDFVIPPVLDLVIEEVARTGELPVKCAEVFLMGEVARHVNPRSGHGDNKNNIGKGMTGTGGTRRRVAAGMLLMNGGQHLDAPLPVALRTRSESEAEDMLARSCAAGGNFGAGRSDRGRELGGDNGANRDSSSSPCHSSSSHSATGYEGNNNNNNNNNSTGGNSHNEKNSHKNTERDDIMWRDFLFPLYFVKLGWIIEISAERYYDYEPQCFDGEEFADMKLRLLTMFWEQFSERPPFTLQRLSEIVCFQQQLYYTRNALDNADTSTSVAGSSGSSLMGAVSKQYLHSRSLKKLMRTLHKLIMVLSPLYGDLYWATGLATNNESVGDNDMDEGSSAGNNKSNSHDNNSNTGNNSEYERSGNGDSLGNTGVGGSEAGEAEGNNGGGDDGKTNLVMMQRDPQDTGSNDSQKTIEEEDEEDEENAEVVEQRPRKLSFGAVGERNRVQQQLQTTLYAGKMNAKVDATMNEAEHINEVTRPESMTSMGSPLMRSVTMSHVGDSPSPKGSPMDLSA